MEETNYFKVSHAIVESSKLRELTPASKWLYVILCKDANRFDTVSHSFFHRSVRYLMDDSCLSSQTVQDGLKQLESVGLIIVYRNGNSFPLDIEIISSKRCTT